MQELPVARQRHVILVQDSMTQHQCFLLSANPPLQMSLFDDTSNANVLTGLCAWKNRGPEFWINLSRIELRSVALFIGLVITTSKRILVSHAFVLVHAVVGSSYPSPTGTAQKLHGLLVHFERHLQGHGLEYVDELTVDHVQEYMWSAQKTASGYMRVLPRTAANRQWAIRQFLGALEGEGFWEGPDLTGDTVTRGASDSSRPMTSREIEGVQAIVSGTLMSTGDDVLVALSLAGGDASEVGLVRLCDVDLASQTVTFHGEAQRTAPLSKWACERISLFLAENDREHTQRIAVAEFVNDQSVARTVTTRLMNVMRMSGIQSNRRVTAKSLRLGSAVEVLHQHGLEASARFLGNQSLDATARMLNYNWWVNE